MGSALSLNFHITRWAPFQQASSTISQGGVGLGGVGEWWGSWAFQTLPWTTSVSPELSSRLCFYPTYGSGHISCRWVMSGTLMIPTLPRPPLPPPPFPKPPWPHPLLWDGGKLRTRSTPLPHFLEEVDLVEHQGGEVTNAGALLLRFRFNLIFLHLFHFYTISSK